MKFNKRKLTYVVCAIISLSLFFLLLVQLIQPYGDNVLDDGWFLKDAGGQIPIELPYQRDVDEIVTLAFTRTISYSDGDALILTWLRGQAMNVSLNGSSIFTIGNSEQPTANFWNNTFLVYLPEPEFEENTLEIQLTSTFYPVNFKIAPFILEESEAEQRVSLVNFFL